MPCGGGGPNHSASLAESERWWKLGLKLPFYPRTVLDGQSPPSFCVCVCVCLSVCIHGTVGVSGRSRYFECCSHRRRTQSSTLIDAVGQ